MGFSFPSQSFLSLTFDSFGFSFQKRLLIGPFPRSMAGLCAPGPPLPRVGIHPLSPEGVFRWGYHPSWVLPPLNEGNNTQHVAFGVVCSSHGEELSAGAVSGDVMYEL